MTPAILLASGPSAKEALSLIKSLQVGGIPVYGINHVYHIHEHLDGWFAADGAKHFTSEFLASDTKKWVAEDVALSYASTTNVEVVPYKGTSELVKQRGTKLFCDGLLPIAKFSHNAIVFAIQMMARLGHSPIWLVGSELQFEGSNPYGFKVSDKYTKLEGNAIQKKRAIYQRVFDCLKSEAPHAKANGVQIVNCAVGGRLSSVFPTMSLQKAYDTWLGTQESGD